MVAVNSRHHSISLILLLLFLSLVGFKATQPSAVYGGSANRDSVRLSYSAFGQGPTSSHDGAILDLFGQVAPSWLNGSESRRAFRGLSASPLAVNTTRFVRVREFGDHFEQLNSRVPSLRFCYLFKQTFLC